MEKGERHPDGNFYGRRLGRPLNTSRQDALDQILPARSIPADQLTCNGVLAPSSLFDKAYAQHWLEIGFGTGEHLTPLLTRHPDTGFIGVEPFINGMAAFCKSITVQDPAPENIRLWMDDAVVLAQSLSDNSLDGIYILNPDPWHKKRHHKRRIVRPETLDIYARILKPGGQLIMSTDVPYLADWMITHTYNHPAFEWSAGSCKDWQIPPDNWVTTAYEVKGAKGAKKMCYLFFEKQHI